MDTSMTFDSSRAIAPRGAYRSSRVGFVARHHSYHPRAHGFIEESFGEVEGRGALELACGKLQDTPAGGRVCTVEVQWMASGNPVCSVSVDTQTTVAGFKEQIFQATQIPVWSQRLFASGCIVEFGDHNVLGWRSGGGLLDNKTVYLVQEAVPDIVALEDQLDVVIWDDGMGASRPYCALCRTWYTRQHAGSQGHLQGQKSRQLKRYFKSLQKNSGLALE
eukprot:CAMPEP_0115196690 /NCGR_PEP_ID=MMETSP0270-20121206/15215_1 /TAXON_ID=71861 /ORGANISM="Scrippsiella trochoidea, Strain CCMP3099" /LENGTH=219 /DNA_ID=CAMNT_0002610029 /DNA_START=77 /DNA_END=736 /DNA_ORIENTATION=-